MKFDPKKPHGIVIGVPGAAYEQEGRLYTPAGEPHVEPRQDELELNERPASGRQPGNQGKRQ